MKVSVVLPVFNAQDTIVTAVDSIVQQTFHDWELLVIDDGSTDSTEEKLEQIKDVRIRVIKTKNRGIARALNFGIKLSRSTIIARMDADDISHPDRLEMQYNYLKDHSDIEVVSSLVKYNGDRLNHQGYALYVDEINKLCSHEEMFLNRFKESPMAHPSVMFRKSLIEKHGGYSEESIPEDYELWLRWFHHEITFHKIKEELITWTDSNHRLSRISDHYSDESFYRLKADYLAKHLKKTRTTLPKVWIWGTGRMINKYSSYLSDHGLVIEKFIDVKSNNQIDKFIHFENLPNPSEELLILPYVRDRIGKVRIQEHLNSLGYVAGQHYFLMS